MKKLRILHAPVNIAGQASTISRSQRALGYQSDVLCYYGNNNYRFPCDIDLCPKGKSTIRHKVKAVMKIASCIWHYDVFHFHFGDTLLPKHRDLFILKLLKKKTLMHYWGSDVIQYGRIGDYSRLEKKHVQDRLSICDDEKKEEHTLWLEQHMGATIVGDYSLLPYSPRSIVVRQVIDLECFPYVGAAWKGGPVKVLHAPTNRSLKGTEYVLKALERLKNEGSNFETVLIEDMSHEEAKENYLSADIVVDDVLMGPYGILAIECMAMGKPVLGFIHEKFIGCYSGLPIVNTAPEQVYENLKELINDPVRREELGRRGRKYVEENHDSKVVVKQILQIYEGL